MKNATDFYWCDYTSDYCLERLTPMVGYWTSSWSHGPLDQHSNQGHFCSNLVVSAARERTWGCIALMSSSSIQNRFINDCKRNTELGAFYPDLGSVCQWCLAHPGLSSCAESVSQVLLIRLTPGYFFDAQVWMCY